MSIFKKLLGSKSARDNKALSPKQIAVNEAHKQIETLDNDQLRVKTLEFKEGVRDSTVNEENQILELKEKIKNDINLSVEDKEAIWKDIDQLEDKAYENTQDYLNKVLPEAFAVIKETAKRFTENEEVVVTATEYDKEMASTKGNVSIVGDKAHFKNEWEAGGNLIRWDMIHYDVQLIGGVVLHDGKIAEMSTGEGKTLVATLPIYLNAIPGKGVHVVTVNDYLAKRDAEWMGVLFEFHGLKVDCIDKHKPNSQERRNAYLADVTYGTNNEFGFDYLRDNMTQFPDELVQRPHNYVIVDEVDSVLIDDARTPLIISGPTPKAEEQEFDDYRPYVEKLFSIQRKMVTKILTEAKAEIDKNTDEGNTEGGKLLLRAFKGMPKYNALIKYLSNEGMKALMQKTENFYLQEQAKKMHLVTDELYFIIDEKSHSVDLTDKGVNFVNDLVGDPNFYIIPDVGAEIAELEKSNLSEKEKSEKKAEVLREFSVKSEQVHTLNQLMKAYTLFEKDTEYVIMDNKIKIVDEQTGRIMEGRRYSDGLHQAIEAKENVKVEAATQTYATITLQNYFRMYRKLAGMTGTAETEAGELWDIYKLDVVVIPTNRPIARDDKEDLVYKTKREKYNSVIDEIEKLVNAKRPVLVGTTSVDTSELLSRMLTRKHIKHNVLNAKLHQREAHVVKEAGQPGIVTIATNMAGRGTDIKLGSGVKEAGGLAIIGTERHDSRRVDRQLRGRAGRQGDPGSSQFFVSLEDDLMRMFGSERIAKTMDRMGLGEGDVIQHSMITKSIERAQKKVEENNFGIRKRLLEYDDVMNTQRGAIYKKRKHALFGDRLSIDISNMIYDAIESVVVSSQESSDYEGFKMDMLKIFATDVPISDKDFLTGKSDKIVDELFEKVYKNYQSKNQRLREMVVPVVKDVLNNDPQYENIAIPISDGHKEMQIVVNLNKANETEGKEVILGMEKNVTLSHIDNAWKEHLREMDDLKQSVQTATYEQKDPLLIYKFESFELFKQLLDRTNKEIGSFLSKAKLPNQEANLQQAQIPRKTDMSNYKETRDDLLSQSHSNTQAKQKTEPVKVEKRVGRNEPCPCGSGKKYKQCHGKS